MSLAPKLSLAELEAFDPRARAGGRERRFCCPLCGGEKKINMEHRSLALNTETGVWQCHRCKADGKITEFWTDRRLQQAGATPRGRAQPPRLPPPPDALEIEVSGDTLTIEGSPFRVLGLDAAASTGAARYLEGRGVGAGVAAACGTMFGPDWYGFPAVVFPLHDGRGRLIAAQGRRIDPRATPKAISRGPISQAVFATAGAWETAKETGRVILTEAPLDALSLAACGYPALALCGSTMWPEWLLPRCAFRRVLLAFDADMGGDEAAARWGAELPRYGANVERLRPEGGKDWNEVLMGRGREWLTSWLYDAMFGQMPPRPTIADFARSGRILSCRSSVLGEIVYFASDNASLSALPDEAVVYRAQELASLKNASADGLRMIHQVKKLFNAEVEDDK